MIIRFLVRLIKQIYFNILKMIQHFHETYEGSSVDLKIGKYIYVIYIIHIMYIYI